MLPAAERRPLIGGIVVAAAAVATVTAGCGNAATSGGSSRGSTAASSEAAAAETTTTAVVGGVTIAAPGPSPGPSSRGTASPSGASDTPATDPAAAARAAFDTWLAALERQDVTTALATSTGPAAALGALQLVADEIASGNGGGIDIQAQNESLRTASVAPTAVALDGHVDLVDSIRSSKSTTQARSRIDGPIHVTLQQGSWRVSDFRYGGQALEQYPEDASQTASGVHVVVAFALSNANLTSILVGVQATSRNRSATLESATLTLASGKQQPLRAFFGKGVEAGLLDAARVADRPARLDLTFKDSVGGTLAFSIPLPGQLSAANP